MRRLGGGKTSPRGLKAREAGADTPIVSTPSPASRRKKFQRQVVPYDFAAPPRLARDQARLLEVSLETFARQWATQLSSRLSCPTNVTFVDTIQMTYDDYVTAMTAPTFLAVFSARDFGTGVIHLPIDAALDHLDHALGGRGGEQTERNLTDIEIAITVNMCERVLSTTKYAFAAFLTDEMTIDVVKQDPQLLQSGRATDMLMVARFELSLDERTHEVSVMLPLGPLQDRLKVATTLEETLSEEDARRAAEAERLLQESLPTVPLNMCLRLTPIKVPPQKVLDLQVGDLVRLHHMKQRPLEVAAAGQVVALGVPTTVGRRRACLIVSTEEPVL